MCTISLHDGITTAMKENAGPASWSALKRSSVSFFPELLERFKEAIMQMLMALGEIYSDKHGPAALVK